MVYRRETVPGNRAHTALSDKHAMRALALLIAFATAACAARPAYVVRLDLTQVAAQTAARDAAPGFASLRG